MHEQVKLESAVDAKPEELLLYAFLTILGFSFWFFLGFPFANHNESYSWIAQMNRMSTNIFEVLRWSPAANYRPLGSITAWIGARLSGGSIYPQQVFNFVVAVLAWLILYSAFKERRFFGFISFIVGGVFFSGYIYLFHLHGVFYSPLLAFIAILIVIAVRNVRITNSKSAVIFTLAILTALYHPFALPVYVAFSIGYFLKSRHTTTRIQFVLGSLFLAAALILARILVPVQGSFLPSERVLGLSTSYKLAELNSGFSIISWLLSITTVLGLATSWRAKLMTSVTVTVISLALVLSNQPVLFLWIAVCLAKTALLKKWGMAFLIASTAILPAVTATGSPTYTVFLLMVCSATVPMQWSLPAVEFPNVSSQERREGVYACSLSTRTYVNSSRRKEKIRTTLDRIVLAASILILSVGILLKSGVYLPVITELATPVLAEREKTFQLESIISWWEGSEYTGYRLVLCQSADNPVASSNVVNRRHRAPTSQVYLDQYADMLAPSDNGRIDGWLLVCFGDEKIPDATVLHTVPGKYNGQAIVYSRHE
jgi:hypothetical protein